VSNGVYQAAVDLKNRKDEIVSKQEFCELINQFVRAGCVVTALIDGREQGVLLLEERDGHMIAHFFHAPVQEQVMPTDTVFHVGYA